MFVASSMQVTTAVPASAAGEDWFGTILWAASGTGTFNDGSTYEISGSYQLEQPQPDVPGVLSGTAISATIVHPDPDPVGGNCWLQRETYTAPAFSLPAPLIEVYQAGTSSSGYMISVNPGDSAVTGLHSTYYAGGTVDGRVCADSNGTALVNGGPPYLRIFSYDNTKPTFRSGQVAVPDRTYGGCSTGSATEECMDTYTLLNGQPPMSASWSLTADPCSGYSRTYPIGDGDTLVVFNPCQTQTLSSRISVFDDIAGTPKVCKFGFTKKVNKACGAYKAVRRTTWVGVRGYLALSSVHGDCGVWVVDRARWRAPKIRPAERAKDGQYVQHINPGGSENVRTATGSLRVSCP